MLTMLATLCLVASAAEPQAPPSEQPQNDHQSAVLVNPVGPVAAGVATVLGTPAFDANIRLHHMHTNSIGWTVQADFLRAMVMDMHAMHSSVRAGPRFALHSRGLTDWSLTPFGSVGYTTLSAADKTLASYAVLGVGVEAGRVWVWNHFALELGLGAYTDFPVAYRPEAEVFVDLEPERISPIKPIVTWSLGYAF